MDFNSYDWHPAPPVDWAVGCQALISIRDLTGPTLQVFPGLLSHCKTQGPAWDIPGNLCPLNSQIVIVV